MYIHQGNKFGKILTKLPCLKRKNKICVNWKSTIGMAIQIYYKDNKVYTIKIIDYNKRYLTFEYNGSIQKPMQSSSFLNMEFGKIFLPKSKNTFRYVESRKYWIGTDCKGYEFLFNTKIEEIMSHTWQVILENGRPRGVNGYVDRKIITLHKFVLEKPFIDHINNNPLDNRIENLRESNPLSNSKNKSTHKYNENGDLHLTGLRKTSSLKYYSRFTVDGVQIYTKSKSYEEAKIENLIIQKHENFTHNEDQFYLLLSIDKRVINEVITEWEKKKMLTLNKSRSSTCSNKFDNDTDFVWVIDSNNNRSKIDESGMIKLKQTGFTAIIVTNSSRSELRVHGYINNKRVVYRYSRWLLDITDSKYELFQVDHVNHDSLDNRHKNYIITDDKGNKWNKSGRGYSIRKNGKYCVEYNRRVWETLFPNEPARPHFDTLDETLSEIDRRKNILFNLRLSFKNKDELDMYLNKYQ